MGFFVGAPVVIFVGAPMGLSVGAIVGISVGVAVGISIRATVDLSVGVQVGFFVGAAVDALVGTVVDRAVGDGVLLELVRGLVVTLNGLQHATFLFQHAVGTANVDASLLKSFLPPPHRANIPCEPDPAG